ncbi:helix-turn-helix domain-containing protein [Streptomyces sp. NPDC005955]|uniref:helix-turn-helix domain-containing protein n=1 Tax=Streptomyces sp. NPDC005955 TaxID=3364738 RepID=UPI0036A6F122
MTTLASDTGVGPLLRGWRERRRVSQLELALRADASARHISFVENGRSRPSEEMILRLAEHLDVPVRERNALLLAGGYAPRYTETSYDDPSMGALREGLQRLLHGYEPYPAIVLNGVYDVVAANLGMTRLLEGVADHLLTPPLNGIRIVLHPDGMAPRILNLRQWRSHLLHQMESQMSLVRSDPLRELYDEVASYPFPDGHPDHGPGGADASGDPGPGPAMPCFALPLRIAHRGRELSFVSSISTFNTPMDVTVAELAIETFLPADAATVDHLSSLSA